MIFNALGNTRLGAVLLVLILSGFAPGRRCLADALSDLADLQQHWLAITTNPEIFPCADYTPSKKGCDPAGDITPAGDMVLFNALLCYSGYERSCSAVHRSQEESGRWRRSPLHINRPVNHTSGSFSKDHVVGLLLYFVRSNDREGAEKWWAWIEAESNRHVPPVLRVCEEDHCILSTNLLSLMYRVWTRLGLNPSREMTTFRSAATDASLAAEARLAKGYELHVKATMALLLKSLDETPRQLIQTIYRKQPENPFYQYLAQVEGELIAKNTIRKCQAITAPNYRDNPGNQWSWERDTQEEAWLQTMGWDCIFMARVLSER